METSEEYNLNRMGEITVKSLAFIDKTPLKYLGSGYWMEKYGLRAKRLIDEFESKADTLVEEGKTSELENLISEYKEEVKKTSRKGWSGWMLSYFPLLGSAFLYGILKSEDFFNYVDGKINLPVAGEIIAGLGTSGILFAGVYLIHDFACPSSIRKHLHYKEIGDKRMCNILNWAGFDPRTEFKKVSQNYESPQ
jgi:hypothetical protein